MKMSFCWSNCSWFPGDFPEVVAFHEAWSVATGASMAWAGAAAQLHRPAPPSLRDGMVLKRDNNDLTFECNIRNFIIYIIEIFVTLAPPLLLANYLRPWLPHSCWPMTKCPNLMPGPRHSIVVWQCGVSLGSLSPWPPKLFVFIICHHPRPSWTIPHCDCDFCCDDTRLHTMLFWIDCWTTDQMQVRVAQYFEAADTTDRSQILEAQRRRHSKTLQNSTGL